MYKFKDLYSRHLILLIATFLILLSSVESIGQDIKLAEHPDVGKILTDDSGLTLYFFTRDAQDGISVCNGGCATAWPVFFSENPSISEELDSSDFSTITRDDGTSQTAYRGWPLYYFQNDAVAGDINGEGLNDVWFVAKPDYTIMLMDNQLTGLDGINYNSSYEEGEEQVQYFTDAYGRTLYIFIRDNENKNNFTRPDFSNDPVWPIFGDSLIQIPTTLDPALFNTIDVFGRPQLTYKGWPLYYYEHDSIRGQNLGVSVPRPGIWPVAVKDLAPAANVAVARHDSLGRILTDAAGNTLYYFTRDALEGGSVCNGGCATAWPVFYNENLVVASGLDSSDFTTITRDDGSFQTAYKGWPLYYFQNDASAGDINGEAVNNVWFVAKPDYSIMLMDDQLTGLDGVNYTSTYEEGEEQVQYFTDAYGRTLYVFIRDNENKNNFTRPDFSNDPVWPIYGDTLMSIPTTLDPLLFDLIDVFGRPQLTYKGWPLYYYEKDSLRGQNLGVSVPRPGVWPVAVKDLAPAANVAVARHDSLGRILTDAAGNTLYYFTRDALEGGSVCNGGCATAWPVFYNENLVVGSGLDSSDFTTITRDDGSFQTAYKGWPLYYFQNDASAGDINGEAVNNVWFVAKPDYSIMLMDDQLTGLDGVNYTSTYEEGEEQVQYFTDAYGRTLYVFIRDNENKNNFTRPDFSNDPVWPIYGDTLMSIPTTLDPLLFDLIDVFGRPQLTYKGWPLYYYEKDSLRGQNLGVSVPRPGVWPVAVKDIDPAANVAIANNQEIGRILTDASGRTLYFFTRDHQQGASMCNGGCATAWPIFYEEDLVIGNGLDSADFSTIIRDDSSLQTAYKGWPLYYFRDDSLQGDINGEAANEVWFVAKPDYTIMLMDDQLTGLDSVNYLGNYEPGDEQVQYFTDSYGRTLYIFINDTENKNNFTREDFSNDPVWPIFGESPGSIPTTLDTSLFSMIDVFGRPQLTYKGWPLYYFGRDSMRGQNLGVSVPAPGVWPVAVRDLNAPMTTAITESFQDRLQVEVGPNPASAYLDISLKTNESGHVQFFLYDSGGNVITRKERALASGDFRERWDLLDLPAGLYVLNIHIGNKFAAYHKILKVE